MGIETILMMIPKGGKYATSVVNKVYNLPKNWEKFQSAVQQIERLLKGGKLKLDGKQKTNYEANKNILKTHEKVATEKAKYDDITKKMWKDRKEYPPFNTSKEDFTKGWTPTVYERQNLRKIYKDLDPPERLYTAEMEAIDEELNELMLYRSGKYSHLGQGEKTEIFNKLQAEMKKLIDIAKKDDLSTLSLSQLNKKSHAIQKRIREIADNPNIKGTVDAGPKHDLIKAIYDSESKGISNARKVITKRNSELKYGKKYPVLDPENDAFIITGLDDFGNPNKMSRFIGKFSADKHPITADLTRKEGTQWWDKWDLKKNKMREEGKEVWHETVDRDGKVIMSNPDYKLPKTELMELQTEFYTDLSTSDLAKKGYDLKQIDMIVKGRLARKYLDTQAAAEPKLDVYEKMHERTNTNAISDIMEDLYTRGDDIYKMSIKEWTKKIPEYFAEGGRTGFHRGSLRHQKEHDYQAYEDKGNFMRYLALSGDRAKAHGRSPEGGAFGTSFTAADPDERMGYDQWRDDYETYMKERFMYGEHKEPLFKGKLDKTINAWIKKKWKKFVEKTDGTEGLATGGISNLFRERQGFRAGTAVELVKGARWLIRMLKSMMDDMIFNRGQFTNMYEAAKMKYFKETEAAVKHLEAGGEIPENLLKTMRADKRFQKLTVDKTADKEFVEMQEVVLGKPSKGKIYKDAEGKTQGIAMGFNEAEIKGLDKAMEEGMAGSKKMKELGLDPSKAKDYEIFELLEFKKTVPNVVLEKLKTLPPDAQLNVLRTVKKAFDAFQKGGKQASTNVIEQNILETFTPKGKPHATGGLIDGYATGGVSNLFRQRQGFRTGNIAKLPEFLKFVERLLIKASNEIRQGIGKWKGLDQKQRIVQHDNLTKLATEFQKTKKFDVKINEYTGIDAEKAFVEAQAKVKEKSIFSMTQEEKAARLKKYQDESGIKLSYGDKEAAAAAEAGADEGIQLAILKGNFERKYTGVIDDYLMKQVLADNNSQRISEVMATIDQSLIMQKKGMGTNEIITTLKDSFKRKPNVEGGLIPGYATGGVSNLFRSR